MEGLSNYYNMDGKLRTAIKLILELLRVSKDEEEKHQLAQAHNLLMNILTNKEKHL